MMERFLWRSVGECGLSDLCPFLFEFFKCCVSSDKMSRIYVKKFNFKFCKNVS